MTDALMTAIAGGTPPDVVLFDRFMVGQWAGESLFTDITDYAKSYGLNSDQYYDFAWE
jgi:multiple sugar transport system substrate-binding protein